MSSGNSGGNTAVDRVAPCAAVDTNEVVASAGTQELRVADIRFSNLQATNNSLVEKLQRLRNPTLIGPRVVLAKGAKDGAWYAICGHETLMALAQADANAALGAEGYATVAVPESDPRLVAFVAAHQTSQKRFAPFDWAQLLREAARRGLDQEDAADACGFTKDRALVSVLQTLANVDHALPQRVRDELRKADGRFGTYHFRAIASEFGTNGTLNSDVTSLITRAAEKGMSVTQLKAKLAKLRLARQQKLPLLPTIAAPTYEVPTDRRPPITADRLKARVEDALALCAGFYPDVAAHLSSATDVLEQLVEAEKAKGEKAKSKKSENETNKE